MLAIICGMILYTLTYKSVPIQSQHEWYGSDLHTYLIVTHSMMFGLGLFMMVVANILLIADMNQHKIKVDIKEKPKDEQ